MLHTMDFSTKEDFINEQYEKLSETGKTKFRMKVAKKALISIELYIYGHFSAGLVFISFI